MNQATLTTLPVEDIVFDSKQPRKFFDQVAHGELTESIKQVGVLQPIMVRPGGTVTGGGKKANRKAYMIICGERRYRAAYEAGLKEIPVVIREGLSDNEVMEIQIIENLQRKDVNPMEEGHAFEKLSQRFSIEEIGIRVGKSTQYVAQRISLTNLIEEFQQILYAGKMTLTQAYKLARLGKEGQDEIFKELDVPEDWKSDDEFELDLDWILSRKAGDYDLNEASFDLGDEDLYVQAGACTTCRFNSANNPTLFPDLNEKKVCHNAPCYSIKEQRMFDRKFQEAAADPDMVFITRGYRLDKEDKSKVKSAEEFGCTVLDREAYDEIDEPQNPGTFEEWSEDNMPYDFDEMGEKEQAKQLKNLKAEYEDEIQVYQSIKREFEEEIKNAKKAYVIAGYDAGKIAYVKLKRKKGSGDTGTAYEPSIEEEIKEIKAKEERNKALDREKVQQSYYTLFEEGSKFFQDESELLETEENALIIAMCENSFTVRHYIAELIEKTSGLGGTLYERVSKSRGIISLHAIARIFIADKLISKTWKLDPESYDNAASMRDVAYIHFPVQCGEFVREQEKKAAKRQASVKARIEALQAKKETSKK